MNRILAVIPARGGSKGLPGKNIKLLCGKPLIGWTIEAVKEILSEDDICVSTDYPSIACVAEKFGLKVPFVRPDILASDVATTREVLIHALDFYAEKGKVYDTVLLLQATSPLRNSRHIREALALYTPGVDMVVSVKKSHAATVIAHENQQGFLELTLNKKASRRQELPQYYEYNGAIYIINVNSLRFCSTLNFKHKVKYVMDDISSLDIDDQLDFDLVNLIKQKGYDNEVL